MKLPSRLVEFNFALALIKYVDMYSWYDSVINKYPKYVMGESIYTSPIFDLFLILPSTFKLQKILVYD